MAARSPKSKPVSLSGSPGQRPTPAAKLTLTEVRQDGAVRVVAIASEHAEEAPKHDHVARDHIGPQRA